MEYPTPNIVFYDVVFSCSFFYVYCTKNSNFTLFTPPSLPAFHEGKALSDGTYKRRSRVVLFPYVASHRLVL